MCPSRAAFDVKCGAEYMLKPSYKWKTIRAEGYSTNSDEICTYQILVDLTNALLAPYLEVKVNYVHAASLYLVHGTTVLKAKNSTTGSFNKTYLFPVLTTQRNINHVWLTSVHH